MPKETVIVIAGILVVFAAFALALGWASLYTRNYRAPRTESKNQLCGDSRFRAAVACWSASASTSVTVAKR